VLPGPHRGQVQDYTNYSRGKYATTTSAVLPARVRYSASAETPVETTNYPGTCYSPSSTWRDHEKNTHQSHGIAREHGP